MNVLIDTNVVIDFLGKRKGFFDNAALIFQVMLDKVEKLCNTFTISGIDKTTLVEALKMNPYDFEDTIQYSSALPYQPDIIITRDKRGFMDLNIPIMTPDEFITKCQK